MENGEYKEGIGVKKREFVKINEKTEIPFISLHVISMSLFHLYLMESLMEDHFCPLSRSYD